MCVCVHIQVSVSMQVCVCMPMYVNRVYVSIQDCVPVLCVCMQVCVYE